MKVNSDLQLLLIKGEYSKVILLLKDSLQNNDELIILIEAYINIGIFSEAEIWLKRLDDIFLEDEIKFHFNYLQALFFFEKGEIKNGFEFILKAQEQKATVVIDGFYNIRVELELNKILFSLGQLDQSEISLLKIIDKLRKKDLTIYEKSILSESYLLLGNIYYEDYDLEKALTQYINSMKLQEVIGNKKIIGKILNNKGVIYFEKNDYKKAINYLIQVKNLGLELNHFGLIAMSKNNIANIYHEQRDRALSKTLHDEALEEAKKFGNAMDVAIILHNIGTYHRRDVHAFTPAIEHILMSKIW